MGEGGVGVELAGGAPVAERGRGGVELERAQPGRAGARSGARAGRGRVGGMRCSGKDSCTCGGPDCSSNHLNVPPRGGGGRGGGGKTGAELQREIDAAVAGGREHPGFVAFSSWGDVMEAARHGDRLWYQALFDRRPRSIMVVKVFKNGGIRIDPVSNQADKFTADKGHLDRFFRKA